MRCGGHTDVVGPISGRGNCRPCGQQAMKDACWQISADDGPVAIRRQLGYARLVEKWAGNRPLPTP